MFDLKLSDIFSTICIGILTLALILFFYFIVNKFFVKDKFDNDVYFNWIRSILGENYKESGYAILALVVIYCMGIIAGDLTERMADSGDTDKNVVLKELKWFSLMESQEDARKEVLFSSDYKLTGLGESVLRTKIIVRNANKLIGSNFFTSKLDSNKDINIQFNKLADTLKHAKTKYKNRDSLREYAKYKARDTLFGKFIQQIYYSGKNWCYSKTNEPLEELKSIQSRIDLAKSMILLVSLSIEILILIITGNALVSSIVYLKGPKGKPKRINFEQFITGIQLKTFLIFGLLLVISNECYDINESNYNKRAYGYYVSYVQQIQVDKQLVSDKNKVDTISLVLKH
ncbi:MAG TPA: hypothetical protein VFE53_08455 [Mucilaginibacter sp.]|jgi:hypothetical protein|nr:hypothetical protein [Mucilaginibacter sp.]